MKALQFSEMLIFAFMATFVTLLMALQCICIYSLYISDHGSVSCLSLFGFCTTASLVFCGSVWLLGIERLSFCSLHLLITSPAAGDNGVSEQEVVTVCLCEYVRECACVGDVSGHKYV